MSKEIFCFGAEWPHCPWCGAGTNYDMSSEVATQEVSCLDCGKTFLQESIED